MVVAQPQDDRDWQQSLPTLDLFPVTPKVTDNNVFVLIPDFFDWLEHDWRLSLYTSDEREPLPSPLTLTKTSYTIADLALIYGCSQNCVYRALRKHHIAHSHCSTTGKGHCGIYKKLDLLPLLEHWEWDRVLRAIDAWWLRFFPPACGACQNCRDNYVRFPTTRQFYCAGSVPLVYLRSVFTDFIEEVRRLGSVTVWWHTHPTERWGDHLRSARGILLIYLLDRRLLSLSDDELVQLEPLCRKSHHELTHLWRNRRPDEYAQFRQAMSAAHYGKDTQRRALIVLSLLVLLKYGLPGLAELGRALSSEELQRLCHEHRLVTMHLGQGIFLPYPLSSDVCVGHVVLDDIRHFFWQYAMVQEQRQGKLQWDLGPRGLPQMTVGVIEQALCAPMYDGRGILSRRPEVERRLMNPWHILAEGKRTNTGYSLLPLSVQEHIMAYLTYRHQEHQRELTSLRADVSIFMRFFTWVRTQGRLAQYPYWTHQQAKENFRSYSTYENPEAKVNTRVVWYRRLASFFSTLEDLDLPVPSGYRLLYTFEKEDKPALRVVPTEDVMDRIFRDGVRSLSYDPFARLALTIQYYCGTRVTETCDLHLLCVLEDPDGHAYLLIPKGKSKEERPFPIVELGMGPLLEYMSEIVALRLFPDGTSRTLGKTNFRYLNDDPERARDWYYLFDRVPDADGAMKQRGRLSAGHVRQALAEALLIAAKSNAHGLFQEETYNSACQYQRKKGQKCGYFAAQEGVRICPHCGSSLAGKLGERCSHILDKDFVCDGVARQGELFCPKCDTPLADFLPITTHVFRHNSVSRAHRAGVSVTHNMRLHGHKTLPMHLRYLHLLLDDTTDEVRQIFVEKRLRDVRQALGSAPGQIIEGGVAYTVSLEQYLGITLQRTLKRRTYGIWGGFWAGALAQRGVASPLSVEDDIVIPEDTYEHTVAQYWYEALGLAVSEVAFEHVTNKKWRAEVPPFLDRHKIETLVQLHLRHIADSLGSALGLRLMETDILEQRRFLDELAEKLRPWWQLLGSIDPLVEMFLPGGGHAFQKQLPPTEPAS